jgi:1-acyl-sn-glycerol-3-phosphate acyltransferase
LTRWRHRLNQARHRSDVPRGLLGGASPRAGAPYRLFRLLFILIGRALFRVRVGGLENLPRTADGRPAGGWIAAGLPHRTWFEPPALVALLPASPRVIMLADGPVMFKSWWRRFLIRRVGGVVPIWSRSSAQDFEAHVDAAQQAIRAGAVFALLPEVGPPRRPPALRRLSSGVAYFALRTGAPILPIVFGGTHELYLRRRIEVHLLPAIDPPTPAPARGSAGERTAADALMARLQAAVEPVAASAYRSAEPASGSRKTWRWLTGRYPQVD